MAKKNTLAKKNILISSSFLEKKETLIPNKETQKGFTHEFINSTNIVLKEIGSFIKEEITNPLELFNKKMDLINQRTKEYKEILSSKEQELLEINIKIKMQNILDENIMNRHLFEDLIEKYQLPYDNDTFLLEEGTLEREISELEKKIEIIEEICEIEIYGK